MVARALIGSTFVGLGYGAWRAPGGRVKTAGPLLSSMRKVMPFVPSSDETAVRMNAAVQTLAGAALTVGVAPRLSSAVLAASLVPTTIGGHAFWAISDPAVRHTQRVQFQKNAAMLGGLIFATIASAKPKKHS